MRIIEPYASIRSFDAEQIHKNIERAGRVCYKSEEGITEESYQNFIRNIIKRGHESVLEHEKLTVTFVVDRDVSHETVRHRIASYSQESTRYCNYSNERFGNEITVIRPFFFDEKSEEYEWWYRACREAEISYFLLTKQLKRQPQEARSVLPNSLKTEIVATYNIREWRHFLKLRAAKAAHPQMRQVAIPLLLVLQARLPILFEGIEYDRDFCPADFAEVKEEEE